jgi:hypothetical protein
MENLLTLIAFVAVWYLLQIVVLPRRGERPDHTPDKPANC